MHSIANMTRNSWSYSAITTVNSINSIVKTGYIGSELMSLMERGLFLYFIYIYLKSQHPIHFTYPIKLIYFFLRHSPFCNYSIYIMFFFFYYFNFFFTQLEERIFNYFQSQIKIRENETPRFFIP